MICLFEFRMLFAWETLAVVVLLITDLLLICLPWVCMDCYVLIRLGLFCLDGFCFILF